MSGYALKSDTGVAALQCLGRLSTHHVRYHNKLGPAAWQQACCAQRRSLRLETYLREVDSLCDKQPVNVS